ncbi:DUF4747 family protein [Haladaptatus cibarius]|uniref:DUF4747 family protein n=1 Tax=Haladaptatus cibarius TaxID=453847 RepID=UPI00130EA025|nr:DUF4747 family protein [Haladaptatus cibarius]
MSDTKFYFTEYEVNGILTTLFDFDSQKTREEREREVLKDYIRKDGPIIEGESGTWYFGRIEDDGDYELGKFGKVYTEEPTTYDEEEGDFIDDVQPNKDADYSMFIIDYSNNLLIYNTKNRIGHQQFRKYFADGFEKENNGVVSLETEYVRNKEAVENVVNEKPVLKADLELKPSNPSSEPEWENLDESIQKMLAKELDIIAESKEGKSLNMDEDLLEQAVEMAQTEYGIDYEIVYVDNGNGDEQIKTINKERDPVSRTEEEPDTLGGLRTYASEFITYATSYLNQDG